MLGRLLNCHLLLFRNDMIHGRLTHAHDHRALTERGVVMLSSEDSAWEATSADSTVESAQSLFAARSAGPTVQRLVIGGHLRQLRERAGITTEQAATAIRGSHSKISRMEHGRVGFKDRDI